MSDNVSDTNKRFEIFVPSPKARINMGAPNTSSTGPFGYTGLSLQSDVHLFIDANKHTLFQTGQHFCGQVGGQWLQYSNANMFLSCTANMNLSADKRVTIAAGGGQGQITALDHGTFPRAVLYNNLELHYRVDRIQVGLFEFFYGRRQREAYTNPKLVALLNFGGVDTEYFDGGGVKAKLEKQTQAKLKGGFLSYASSSLRELYPVDAGKERDIGKHSQDTKEPGDPVALIDPLVHKKVLCTTKDASEPADITYGFSSYLQRFDPYARANPADFSGIAKGFVKLRNGLSWMRRFADVCLKYADLLTDNFLMKRAQAAMGAVDGLAKATTHMYHVVEPTIGVFEGTAPNPFVDEYKSGLAARFGGSDPGEDADAAEKALERAQASVQSTRGPWDLAAESASTTTANWVMTIDWDGGGSRRQRFNLGEVSGSPTPAVLSINSAGFASAKKAKLIFECRAFGSGESGGVEIEVNGRPFSITFDHANASISSRVAQRIKAVLAPSGANVRGSGSTITIETASAGSAQKIEVLRDWAQDSRSRSITRMTFDNGKTAVGSDAQSGSLVLWINGSDVVSLHFDSTNANTAAKLRNAIAGSLTGCSVAGSGRSPITITTTRKGSTASIEVLSEDGGGATSTSAALTKLGLTVGDRAQGTDPMQALDLSAVTAAQVLALIKAKGVVATELGGTIKLESKKKGNGSEIRVSGNLGDALWQDQSKHEKIKVTEHARRRARSKSFYASLISWNHELQKLPEDVQNLTRPLRNAVNDVVASMSALEQAAESAMEVVSGNLLPPPPPEAIGLIANDGITLGTQDRIVGTGGKGIVFVADGGSGDEDHQKFVPKVEQFVNVSLAFDPIDKKFAPAEPATKKPPSLGFKVLSDSSVDLVGTYSSQLLALGRAKITAGADGRDVVGIGVARVAGSRAAEVAGYDKVVVSARNPGKSGDADGKTGGRVEVAGQTIAIGGVNLPKRDNKDDLTDFAAADGFGVAPLAVQEIAGAEHLDDKETTSLKKELENYCWPKTLREGGDTGHPNTKHVVVHAEKDTVIVVGPYVAVIDAKEGVSIGTREPSNKEFVNKLDTKKPTISMTDKKIEMKTKEDGATLTLEGDKTTIKKDDNDLVVGPDGVVSNNKKFLMKGDSVDISGSRTYKISGQDIKYAFKGMFKIG